MEEEDDILVAPRVRDDEQPLDPPQPDTFEPEAVPEEVSPFVHDFMIKARAEGMTWDQIHGFLDRKRQEATAQGVSDEQVDKFIGYKPPVNVDKGIAQETEQDLKMSGPLQYTQDVLRASVEGMNRSSLGRVMNSMFEGFNFGDKGTAGFEAEAGQHPIVAGVMEGIGDIPAGIAGLVVGAPGGPVGMGAGAFALPTSIKEVYAEGIDKGEVRDPSDFLGRVFRGTWETTKAGVIGAATFATGGIVSTAAAKAGMAPLERFLARLASDVTTITAGSSVLNWKWPDIEEVVDLTGIVVATHGLTKGAESSSRFINTAADSVVSTMKSAKTNLLKIWSRDRDGRTMEEIVNDPNPRVLPQIVAGPDPVVRAGSSRSPAGDQEFMIPRLRGDFDTAVDWVFKHEGFETTDTGGFTRYGISQNAHPDVDVTTLTKRMAEDIYHKQYWKGVDADNLPAEARLPVFDAAVNQGVGKAKEMWRESGGDVQKFLALRADHYANLAKQDKYAPYFDGWMNRLKDQGYEGPTGQEAILARASQTEGSFAPPLKLPDEVNRGNAEFNALVKDYAKKGEVLSTPSGDVRLVRTQDSYGELSVEAVGPDGTVVGRLFYLEEPGFNPDVWVDGAWRRKGVASAMYDLAERTGGKIPPVNDPHQNRTEEGAAFRAGRDVKNIAGVSTTFGKKPPPKEPPEPGSPESDRNAIRGRIALRPEKESLWTQLSEGAHSLYTGWVKAYHPINRLIAAATRGESIDQGVATKLLLHSADVMKTKLPRLMIEEGQYTLDGNKINGDGLKQIVQDARKVAKGDDSLVEEFVRARMAQQDEGMGLKHGMDMDAVNRFTAAHPELEPILGRITAWRNASLELLVEGGVRTREQVDTMIAENPLGIPRYRELDEGQGGPGMGPGGFTATNPIREARGSERKYRPLLDSLMEDAFRRSRDAHNNRVSAAVAELGLASKQAEKTAVPARKFDMTEAEKQKFDIDEDADASIWRMAGMARRADEVGYFKDGEFQTVKFADPEVMRILKGMDYVTMSFFGKTIAKVMDFTAASIRAFPAFGPTVAVYDLWQGYVTRPADHGSKAMGPNTPARFIEGFVAQLVKSENFRKWEAGPGDTHLFDMVKNDVYLRKAAETGFDPAFNDAFWNAVKSPYSALKAWNHLFLNAIEVGTYSKALREGQTPEMAAALSAESSYLGGTRAGRFTANLNAKQAFFSSWVQIMDQSVKSLFTGGKTELTQRPYNRGHTLLKGFLSITLPGLALWWLNKDDKRWKDAAPYIQKGMFPIFTGPDDGTGTTHWLPIPQPLAALFLGAPISVAQSVFDDDAHAFDDWEDMARSAIIPAGGIFGMGALTPTIETLTNHSFLTGEPIVRDGQKRYLPEWRDSPYSTETSKWIGNQLGYPAQKVDHLIRGYGGSLTWGLVKNIENTLQSVGAVKPLAPSLQVEDWAGFGSFQGRYPMMAAQPTQKYMDRMTTVDQTYATLVKLIGDDNLEGFAEVLGDDPVSATLHAYKMQGISGDLATMNPRFEEFMALLDDQTDRLTDEQLEKVDALYELKDQIDMARETSRLIGGVRRGDTTAPEKMSFEELSEYGFDETELMTANDKRQMLDVLYIGISDGALKANKLMDEMGFK